MDNIDISYYLLNGTKPKEFTVYSHKDPTYLKNYNNKKDNYCPTHGFHKGWSFAKNKKFKNWYYDVFRCKKCLVLCTLYRYYKHPLKEMLKSAKRHAKEFGNVFSLTIYDLFNQMKKQKVRCALTNTKFDIINNRPSLDQIIPSSGYKKENIQFLLINVNLMKSNFSCFKYLKNVFLERFCNK